MTTKTLSRRHILFSTAALATLVACRQATGDSSLLGGDSGEGGDSGPDGDTAAGEDTGLGGDTGTGEDTGSDEDTGGSGGDEHPDTIDATAWATGGTAAMTAAASYPNPFDGVTLGECAQISSTTEGPCTTTTTKVRQDISEGWDGLPVRLVFKIVDDGCSPLAGKQVKIWHTNYAGSYSGETPNAGMCLTDRDYSAQNFGRGAQVTDAEGIVQFDTCFPGWYSSRAVHIHIQVEDSQVSQVFFPASVTKGVFNNHKVYKGFGQPDTSFDRDTVIGSFSDAQRALLIMDVRQMSDGAMLASKALAVR